MELFAPNNLSRRTPQFVPLEKDQLCKEVHDLWRTNYTNYQLDIQDVFVHDGPSIVSSNYLIVLNSGKAFLKCRPGLNSGRRLRWEAQLAAHLNNDGLPVARPLLNDVQHYISTASGSCWVLYEYHEGNYFTGQERELESASEIFERMVKALENVFHQWGENLLPLQLVDFSDFQRLVDEAISRRTMNSTISELCREHRLIIDTSCEEISLRRDLIESPCKPVHLDFHPLNLLVADGEVVCVLDFEDIVVYPLLAALGFGGYKLIRQMMVDPIIRKAELRSPTLARRWLASWHRTSSGRRYSIGELGSGAKYRVLDLIHKILFASLRQNDARYEYDLAKQIGGLYEIDIIFNDEPNLPLVLNHVGDQHEN